MHEIARRAIEGEEPFRVLVEAFYAKDGPLAELGWQVRSQQVQMSLLIADQMDEKLIGPVGGHAAKWGFVEAPCGTGKSLAYGVPGLLAALRGERQFQVEVAAAKKAGNRPPAEARKLIVTTANIALQEQLVKKDFPALAAMLGVQHQLRIVLLKGRANFLCRHKMRALGGALIADPKIGKLLQWAEEKDCDGDRESLLYDPGNIWQDVSVGSEDCLNSSCPHFSLTGAEGKPCFWRKSIDGWATAHIIVTNHHFLALAKGIRSCLLAVDESHELEASLRGTQARTLSPHAGKAMARRLEIAFQPHEAKAVVQDPIEWVMGRAVQWLADEQPEDQAKLDVLKLRPDWLGENKVDAQDQIEEMENLFNRLTHVCVSAGCVQMENQMIPPRYSARDEEAVLKAGKLAKLWDAFRSLIERFRAVVMVQPDPEWPAGEHPWAFYLEREQGRKGEEKVVANMCPADVSWATMQLSHQYPCAVFTTATMPAFGPQRVALGLGGETLGPEPRYEVRLPSPFDLARQGVLLVPNGPRPGDAEWAEWAVENVVQAVQLAGGGCLVLASSTKQMKAYGEALRTAAGGQAWDVKVQGETGRSELRRWFRENLDGVLVGTRSFFQGLDVQGEACRCVIIDRIPFARPDDPLEEAVGQLMVSRASPPSTAYLLRTIPGAAMILAQGAGRLIRSQEDLGSVVLLDNRVLQQSAGWVEVRKALPPFPLSRDMNDIQRRAQRLPLLGTGQRVVGRVIRRSA